MIPIQYYSKSSSNTGSIAVKFLHKETVFKKHSFFDAKIYTIEESTGGQVALVSSSPKFFVK